MDSLDSGGKFIKSNMEKIVNPKITILIFFICILKYYLINILEVVSNYGDIHRLISWVLILPLTIIGFLISLFIIFKSLRNLKENFLSFLMALPMIFYVFYFFVYK